MEIRTERLKLRHARPDDLAGLHVILSDPRATRWWSTPPHETTEQTSAWLDDMMAGNATGSDDFIIEREGRVIGKAGFFAAPELGYILHPDHWGQGLAFEAVTAAVDHVFATRDHEALHADVDPANQASIRLLEKLGFVRTGFAEKTLNIGGEWKDSLYYGLTRAAWNAR